MKRTTSKERTKVLFPKCPLFRGSTVFPYHAQMMLFSLCEKKHSQLKLLSLTKSEAKTAGQVTESGDVKRTTTNPNTVLQISEIILLKCAQYRFKRTRIHIPKERLPFLGTKHVTKMDDTRIRTDSNPTAIIKNKIM